MRTMVMRMIPRASASGASGKPKTPSGGTTTKSGGKPSARANEAAKRRSSATSSAFKNAMAMPTAEVKEATDGPLELASDDHRVLVLDVSYQTIDIVSWQRAVVLLMFDKVDVVSYYDGPWALSAEDAYLVPAVVRTRSYSRHRSHKTPLVSLHRKNIFIRDGFKCQYCGKGDSLTVDHVHPASKGGPWTWENLTTACASCNNKKGDKTLAQSGMKLAKEPAPPTVASMCLYNRHGRFVNPPEEWVPFIPQQQIVRTGMGSATKPHGNGTTIAASRAR